MYPPNRVRGGAPDYPLLSAPGSAIKYKTTSAIDTAPTYDNNDSAQSTNSAENISLSPDSPPPTVDVAATPHRLLATAVVQNNPVLSTIR